jgi:hypothetical protein
MTSHWHPPEHDGIREQTPDGVNRKIDLITRGAIAESEVSAWRIRARLGELDREWNVDRALMLNFAVVAGLSSSLAMRSLARRGSIGGWGAMFFTQIGFLAYHAVKRWCPPMAVFRRLGFRSAKEIAAERCALEQQLAVLEA